MERVTRLGQMRMLLESIQAMLLDSIQRMLLNSIQPMEMQMIQPMEMVTELVMSRSQSLPHSGQRLPRCSAASKVLLIHSLEMAMHLLMHSLEMAMHLLMHSLMELEYP